MHVPQNVCDLLKQAEVHDERRPAVVYPYRTGSQPDTLSPNNVMATESSLPTQPQTSKHKLT